MHKQKRMLDSSEHDVDEDGSYLGQTIAEIIRRDSRHELATTLLCEQTPLAQVFGYNTDDEHLLNFMPKLRRLYTWIMAGDNPPVEPVFDGWANRPGYKLTRLGRQALDACNYYASQEEDGRNWQEAYSHHRFHPIVAVMLRAVMRWGLTITRWSNPEHAMLDGGRDAEAVEKLRQLVAFVRRTCRSQAFQNLLHDHERKAEDNFRSGCDYLSALFERHSRLLILRIDLYFRPDAKGWGYSKAADRAVSNYLRGLRMCRIVPGYRGFLIKRENGISRGMHYHLMVVLDGHMHRSAYYLTRVMGEAWIKRVGADKGSYFNCYANRNRYCYNGLGLVHVSDTEKLLGLRIALWYMSKQDSELKVDEAKVKNFWRGLMPGEADRRGATRKGGDGMPLVRRLLGGARSKYPLGFEPPKGSVSPRRRQPSCARINRMSQGSGQAVPTLSAHAE
ncbi:inovirus-type Gp2 protein [Noviluteimonas gilva]|uniref:Inovirus Gp2 family protein n=1 Tax=Noviluteimonas gilva TaxID=2682097 RepID=A0A7C9LFV4_9GAMM|nr:inovirus-type Gp2 protein [Lysobacter gilvus]MUV13361.1 inovirus Gp2 family protein [Lysobacter gilvus]